MSKDIQQKMMSLKKTDRSNELQDQDQGQSPAANIERGTCRLLTDLGYTCVTELSLSDKRRADITALSMKGDIIIVEIKSGPADFRADNKWPDYLAYCDRLYFAVDRDFPLELLPEDTGIIIADRFAGEIMRDALENRLPASSRKAITLRFARCAATRLQDLCDPGLAALTQNTLR